MAAPLIPAVPEQADLRAAVDMSVKLSTQLIASSLGMLAVEGALLVYTFTYKETTLLFWIFAALCAAFFIASNVAAGQAITQARNAGFEGTWRREAGRAKFNAQAGFLFGGLVALAAMILTIIWLPSRDTNNLAGLQSRLDAAEQRAGALEQRAGALEKRADALEQRDAVLAKRVEFLEQRAMAPCAAPAASSARKRRGGGKPRGR